MSIPFVLFDIAAMVGGFYVSIKHMHNVRVSAAGAWMFFIGFVVFVFGIVKPLIARIS